MSIERVPVTLEGLLHVTRNMRERDRREIFALRWDDDPDALANAMIPYMGATTHLWTQDGVPVSLQGVVPLRRGVWDVFAFGTDAWPAAVSAMTRHAVRTMMPMLLRVDFHRAECRALITHTDSRRWIESLGAREECVLRAYGRNGEDFVSYVWEPDDVRRRWRRWGSQPRPNGADRQPDTRAARGRTGRTGRAEARI